MFKLAIVGRGTRQSVCFVTRLDKGEVFYHNAASFVEHCIIHNMCEIGAYASVGRCYYHLPGLSEQVRY